MVSWNVLWTCSIGCIIIIHYILANDSCDNGAVCLVNGTTMSEGIFEVCLNSLWGNLLFYGLNTSGAEVVCRQLGLSWGCEFY